MSFLGVYGHVVLDHVLPVPHLPEPNTSIEIDARERFFGGTGGNIARAAARLGVPTALAAFVGDDFPREYREALEGDGVDVTDLREVAGEATPSAWIFSDPQGAQVAVIDQGPMKEMAHRELLQHPLHEAAYVHLATGRPAYYARVVEAARARGVQVGFDPSQEVHYVYDAPTFRHLIERADLYFGNESEVQRGLEYLGLEEVRDLLSFVPIVVQTHGRRGSEVHTAEAAWEIPPIPPASVVDVTGAGDAFRGGFYAGLFRDLPLPQCALVGAAAASFCLEGTGPQGGLADWTETRQRATRYEEQIVERPP